MTHYRLQIFRIAFAIVVLLVSLFVMKPLIPTLAVSPSITLSLRAGPPTSITEVHGTGFKSSEMLSIDFDTTLLATITTSKEGTFLVSIPIPKMAQPGNHAIQAIEQINGHSTSTTFFVQTSWAQLGFNAQHVHFNPYENSLNTSNVSRLQGGKIAYTGFYVHSSPIVVNGILYIAAGFNVSAYQVCQCWASLLWTVTTEGQDDVTLAVANGIVYVASSSSTNGSLLALDALTGSTLWTVTIGSPIYSAPTISHGVIYVASAGNAYGGQLYALNALSGSRLWVITTPSINNSSPAVVNGIIYVGAEDHNLYAYSTKTGAELWSAPTGDAIYSSPSVANGIVYVGSYDGKLYAFNAITGILLWTYTTQASIFYSSPAVAKGIVYIGSQDNTLYALNAVTGNLLWSDTTGGIITSSPTIANGVLYFSSWDNHVYALNAITGAVLWNSSLESQTESSPTVVNGTLIIGTSDEYLCLFSLPSSTLPRSSNNREEHV